MTATIKFNVINIIAVKQCNWREISFVAMRDLARARKIRLQSYFAIKICEDKR
jgi:hypothetical protein